MPRRIAEVIVVEGVHDANAVLRAVDADVLCTGGFAFGADVEARLQRAHDHRGLIVLTDPDVAGEQIRRRVQGLVGDCGHAHLDRADCTRHGDIGVEHADPEAIRRALSAARTAGPRAVTFTVDDLWRAGLTGGPGAKARRTAVGKALGLGFGNARQLLVRLNRLGVTREEFDQALAPLTPPGEPSTQ